MSLSFLLLRIGVVKYMKRHSAFPQAPFVPDLFSKISKRIYLLFNAVSLGCLIDASS